MPEPATALIVGSLISAGTALATKPKSPGTPAPPAGPDPNADILRAESAKRRAMANSGRQSTILVDDTETPIGQQIPAQNIGRATLLGS